MKHIRIFGILVFSLFVSFMFSACEGGGGGGGGNGGGGGENYTLEVDCSDPGPNPVNEGSSMQCSVTATDGEPVVDNQYDDCGGAIQGSGPWVYNFTPTDEQGPGTCAVVIEHSEDDSVKDGDLIEINEVNEAPTNNAPEEVSGDELTQINFDTAPTDDDIPEQILTSELVDATGACADGSLTGDVWSWTTTEADGPTSCDVTTRVSDGVEYSDVTTHVVVNEVNTAPTNNAPEEVTGDEQTQISFDTAPTDNDVPDQILTSELVDATGACADGSLTGDVWSWTTTEADGPTSCDVTTRVSDGVEYSDVTTHVVVNEVNEAPTNNAPEEVSGDEQTQISFGTVPTDSDLPAQELTSGVISATGLCVNGVISDNVWSWTPARSVGPTSCDVVTRVFDGFDYSEDVTTHVLVTVHGYWLAIDCSNPGPNPVDELSAIQCTVIASSEPQINTMRDTCGGTINGTGPWTYDFTPTETQGPGSCIASAAIEIIIDDAVTCSNVVNINEANIPPVNNAPAKVAETKPNTLSFNTNPTDTDLPPQTLTSSVVSATGACTNGTFSGNIWSWTPTEADSPASCDVTTSVFDGVDYTYATTHIICNTAPTITVDCPASANETNGITCPLTVSDLDIPAQSLTCSIASCTGGAGEQRTTTIGDGTTNSNLVINLDYYESRTQVIYLASEIGAAGLISALAFNVTGLPGRTLNGFTIKIKHTSLSQATGSWESGGTTVYGGNLTISSTGWKTFTFTTPFYYNGTDNLMVDFRSQGGYMEERGGYVQSTPKSGHRSTYPVTAYGNHNLLGMWLPEWHGLYTTNQVPNIKFTFGACVGAILSGCSSLYIPSQGEYSGPGTISVTVGVRDIYGATGEGSDSIEILEVNTPPDNNAPAKVTVTKPNTLSFNTDPTDVDFPPQTLTSAIVSATGACTKGTLTENEWTWTPTEADGPVSCDVTTSVFDGTDYTDATTHIFYNTAPTITVDCPASAGETDGITCPLTASDLDIPAQNLTCSIASCSGEVEQTVTIGSGTSNTTFAVGTNYHDERTQVIYLASEMGGAGVINSLAIYIYRLPGQTMNNFTIRMKHTSLSYFATASWEDSSSWTTVYQNNLTITSTGWNAFTFTTPFSYNGTDNLMVDFSFNNDSLSSYGYSKSTKRTTNRTIYRRSDSAYGDPLTWSGTTPTPSTSTYTPNIKFTNSSRSGVGSCLGATLSGCSSLYIPSQGEYSGPGTINVTVEVEDSYGATGEGSDSVAILEVNTPPVNNATASVTGNELTSLSFGTSPTDSDVPIQTLTSSVVSATGACTNGTFTGNTWSWTPAEADGPTSCDVVTHVYDGVDYSSDKTTHVKVSEVNVAPVNNALSSVVGFVLNPISIDINPTDVDVPTQTLTCSQVSNACSGGTLSGCSWSWTPALFDGPVSCNVVTRVYDGVAYSSNVTTKVIVTDGGDTPPTNNAPATVTGDELTAISFSTSPTDPESPPQTLTSSVVSATGACTRGSFSGNTWSWTPTEAQGPTSCDVVSRVFDGITYGSSVTTRVIVNEANNMPPVWSVEPAQINVSIDSDYDANDGLASDPDLPAQNLTCTKVSQDCSFTVTVSGSGTGSVNCHIAFTAGSEPETCNVEIMVADPQGANVTDTVQINVVSEPKVWYVDIDAVGAETGESWEDAFTAPQDAVDTAITGDMVWVAEGTYVESATIQMKDEVEIYGGFVGTETALTEREYPSLHPTILDGSGSRVVVSGASYAKLDGFTIQNGYAQSGSGITISGVTKLELANCVFSDNWAMFGGGAISINNTSSDIEIKDCLFEDNQVGFPDSTGFSGGAIASSAPSVAITRTTFVGNRTMCDLDLSACANEGGAIIGLNMTISDCVFEDNYSVFGGAIYATGTLTIINSVFDSNVANWKSTAKGGAIYAGNITIINGLFKNNKSYYGGAIFTGSSPIIINSTFTGNNCNYMGPAGYGGAIYVNGASSLPDIKNCILWGNIASYGSEIYNNGGTPTVTYSDIKMSAGSVYAGTGNINSDPLFVSTTDFHLTLGSPCVNTGTNTGAPAYDLDGNPRPSPVDGTVDMGAYEYQYLLEIDCSPNPANEGTTVNCEINASETPEVDSTNDTCYGLNASITGSGPWVYSFNAYETMGPGACVAAVQLTTDSSVKSEDVVTINEVNMAPFFRYNSTSVTRQGGVVGPMPITFSRNGEVKDIDMPIGSSQSCFSCSVWDTCAPFDVTVDCAGCDQAYLYNFVWPPVTAVTYTCYAHITATDGWGASSSFDLNITVLSTTSGACDNGSGIGFVVDPSIPSLVVEQCY